jgi:hypothetical protein
VTTPPPPPGQPLDPQITASPEYARSLLHYLSHGSTPDEAARLAYDWTSALELGAFPPAPAPAPAPAEPAKDSDGVIHAKGQSGQVHFDGQFVTITRKGFIARATVGKGEKQFHISRLVAVQMKPAGLVVGFIQFTLPGGNERRSRFGRQSIDAGNDENSVTFNHWQQSRFTELRDALQKAMAGVHAVPAPVAPAAPDLLDQLRRLGDLRDAGVLSMAEFEQQKARILG